MAEEVEEDTKKNKKDRGHIVLAAAASPNVIRNLREQYYLKCVSFWFGGWFGSGWGIGELMFFLVLFSVLFCFFLFFSVFFFFSTDMA